MADLESMVRRIAREEQAAAPTRDSWVPHPRAPMGGRRAREEWKAGRLKGFKRGRVVYFRRSEIDRWVTEGERVSVTPTRDQAVERDMRDAFGRS